MGWYGERVRCVQDVGRACGMFEGCFREETSRLLSRGESGGKFDTERMVEAEQCLYITNRIAFILFSTRSKNMKSCIVYNIIRSKKEASKQWMD